MEISLIKTNVPFEFDHVLEKNTGIYHPTYYFVKNNNYFFHFRLSEDHNIKENDVTVFLLFDNPTEAEVSYIPQSNPLRYTTFINKQDMIIHVQIFILSGQFKSNFQLKIQINNEFEEPFTNNIKPIKVMSKYNKRKRSELEETLSIPIVMKLQQSLTEKDIFKNTLIHSINLFHKLSKENMELVIPECLRNETVVKFFQTFMFQ